MGFGLPALGFWIFVGSIIVASIWSSVRQKADKHETLRRIVEKTGTIDEAMWKELFKDAPAEGPEPFGGYRALRISGTIIMFVGAAIGIFFLVPTLLFGRPHEWGFEGLGISAGIATLGFGVFFSSRFAESPADSRNEPPAP
jgi:hypothetical protein